MEFESAGFGATCLKTTEDRTPPILGFQGDSTLYVVFQDTNRGAILTRCVCTFGWFVPTRDEARPKRALSHTFVAIFRLALRGVSTEAYTST